MNDDDDNSELREGLLSSQNETEGGQFNGNSGGDKGDDTYEEEEAVENLTALVLEEDNQETQIEEDPFDFAKSDNNYKFNIKGYGGSTKAQIPSEKRKSSVLGTGFEKLAQTPQDEEDLNEFF